jgi:CheY-like chemotaxis protein
LIAHESTEFCAAVQKILASEPFNIVSCHDGKEALDLVNKLLPDVVLLNVALPTMYGFQICEALRADPKTKHIKIILLAAIYDKTKYKRSPQTLYGADDYIEQHHIPDALAPMIYRLVADTVPATNKKMLEKNFRHSRRLPFLRKMRVFSIRRVSWLEASFLIFRCTERLNLKKR